MSLLYLIMSCIVVIELKIDRFQSRISPEKALSYLGHYGYFSPISTKNLSLFDSFSESLRNFQNFFGLRQTGLLDSDTQEFMKKPRKGLPKLLEFCLLDFHLFPLVPLSHFSPYASKEQTGVLSGLCHRIIWWFLLPSRYSKEGSTVKNSWGMFLDAVMSLVLICVSNRQAGWFIISIFITFILCIVNS